MPSLAAYTFDYCTAVTVNHCSCDKQMHHLSGEATFAINLVMLPYDEHIDMLQADARSLHGVHVACDHTLGLSAAGGASASAPSK